MPQFQVRFKCDQVSSKLAHVIISPMIMNKEVPEGRGFIVNIQNIISSGQY